MLRARRELRAFLEATGVLDELRRVASLDHSADCRFVAVDYHLRKAFRKLEVKSRHQLKSHVLHLDAHAE